MDQTVPYFSRELHILDRVAARYGLSSVLYENSGTVDEHDGFRDATDLELDMWRTLVPEDVRALVDRVWRDPSCALPATPEEVYSSVLYGDWTYLCAEDFCVLHKLPCFHPALDRASLLDGLVGSVHGRWRVVVSRLIPQGTFFSSGERTGVLHPFRPPGLARFLPPPLDPADLLGIHLQPLKVSYATDLVGMSSPGEMIA